MRRVMVSKLIKGRSRKVGLPPGSPVHIGEEKTCETKITVLDYDELHLQEKEIERVDEIPQLKDTSTVTWINVDGVHEVGILQKIADRFRLHPLVLEDIMNTDQRPKIEDFGEYIYVVLKMLYYDDEKREVATEQVSLILSARSVISFQEREGDVFDPIRDRVRTGRGLIRKMGADYLVYALIDSIVDNYFTILEKLGEKIEFLEDELVSNPAIETLQEIHKLKRDMVFLRKSVWPLREVISRLERGGSPLIKEGTVIYFRDVYDHTIQVIDAIETFRDVLSGMLDIYLSSVSNRMNEVMKVLTIIATIFIPLTLIAGVYGMNFRYMPELESQWSYPTVLLAMLVIGILMLVYFRKRKWL
jgi:magnesium transporter